MYNVVINLKNLFSHLFKFYISDINIISYPKSGRTWLIEIINELNTLNKSVSKKKNFLNSNKFKTLEYKNLSNKIFFSHHYMDINHGNSILTKILQKFTNLIIKKKTIFIVRDPRDVIISYYFHLKYLYKIKILNLKSNSINLENFIFSDFYGIIKIIKFYNFFSQKIFIENKIDIVLYENLNKKENNLNQFFVPMGLEVEDDISNQIFANTSIDNLRKKEILNKKSFNKDFSDLKFRKGKNKGYFDYLNDRDITKINRIIKQNLSKEFLIFFENNKIIF